MVLRILKWLLLPFLIDFEKVYSLFLSKLGSYRPREFVIKDLSIDVCCERFMDLVREVKGRGWGPLDPSRP